MFTSASLALRPPLKPVSAITRTLLSPAPYPAPTLFSESPADHLVIRTSPPARPPLLKRLPQNGAPAIQGRRIDPGNRPRELGGIGREVGAGIGKFDVGKAHVTPGATALRVTVRLPLRQPALRAAVSGPATPRICGKNSLWICG